MNNIKKVAIPFLIMIFSLSVISIATGEQILVYGPETFKREKGRPKKERRDFEVNDPSGICTIVIKSGRRGRDGDSRSHDDESRSNDHDSHDSGSSKKKYKKHHGASAKIWLNGVLIAKPSDLKEHKTVIVLNDILENSNILEVKLKGKSHSRITISIFCEQLPSLVAVPALRGLIQAGAEAALSDAGLVVGNIYRERKATIPTGVVIGQDPQAGEMVAEGSEIEMVLVAGPGEGIMIPDAWAGEWEITLTSLDADTNNIIRVNTTRNAICSEDLLGLKLLEDVIEDKPSVYPIDINGDASDSHIQTSISGQFVNALCFLDFTLQLDIYLNNDNTLTGAGQWSVIGECVGSNENLGKFNISGIRHSTEPGELCDLPVSSFMQKFLRHPFLFDKEGPL